MRLEAFILKDERGRKDARGTPLLIEEAFFFLQSEGEGREFTTCALVSVVLRRDVNEQNNHHERAEHG